MSGKVHNIAYTKRLNGWLKEEEIEYITDLTERINTILSRELYNSGIMLGDFKVEYGRTINREILLADEVGTPDGCRFRDSKEFEKGVIKSLDKDVFRKGKGDLCQAYVELFEPIASINRWMTLCVPT